MRNRRLHDRSFCRGEIWAVFVALATGCAPTIGSAVRAYEHGRYPEALDELLAEEHRVTARGGAEGARYALYRGLSHWALGDLRATNFWFEWLERAIAADPTLLSPEESAELASARAHLPR
jgi:hypothetical protein